MLEQDAIGFGDNVRVRSAPETVALGVHGRVGQVYALTTPSVTGVDVIGASVQDRAINVSFDGRSETLWFAPELLEFIDHGTGTTIEIGQNKATRNADGSWASDAQSGSFLARLLKIFR